MNYSLLLLPVIWSLVSSDVYNDRIDNCDKYLVTSLVSDYARYDELREESQAQQPKRYETIEDCFREYFFTLPTSVDDENVFIPEATKADPSTFVTLVTTQQDFYRKLLELDRNITYLSIVFQSGLTDADNITFQSLA